MAFAASGFTSLSSTPVAPRSWRYFRRWLVPRRRIVDRQECAAQIVPRWSPASGRQIESGILVEEAHSDAALIHVSLNPDERLSISMQFLTYLTLAGCLCQAYDSVIHTIVWSNICPKVWEDSTMSHAKQASKRKRRSKALPVLGAAGLSLSLASGASAVTSGPAADMPTRNTGASHEITLGEEEISDVSLATFYVFDKENAGTSRPGVQLARGGCHGCQRLQRLRRLSQRLRRLRGLRGLRRLRRLRRLWRLLVVVVRTIEHR